MLGPEQVIPQDLQAQQFEIRTAFFRLVGRLERGVLFFDREAENEWRFRGCSEEGYVLFTKLGEKLVDAGKKGYYCQIVEGGKVKVYQGKPDKGSGIKTVEKVFVMEEDGTLRGITGEAVFERGNPCLMAIPKTRESVGFLLVFSRRDLNIAHREALIRAKLR